MKKIKFLWFTLCFCLNQSLDAAEASALPKGVALTNTVPPLAYCKISQDVLDRAYIERGGGEKRLVLSSSSWKQPDAMVFNTNYLEVFVPQLLKNKEISPALKEFSPAFPELNKPMEYVAEMFLSKLKGDKLPQDPELLLGKEFEIKSTVKMNLKISPLPLCHAIECLVRTAGQNPEYNLPERRERILKTFTVMAENTYPNLLAHKPVKNEPCYGPLGFALQRIFESMQLEPELHPILVDMIKVLIKHHPLVGKVNSKTNVSPFDLLAELHQKYAKPTVTHHIAALFLLNGIKDSGLSEKGNVELWEIKNRLIGLPEVNKFFKEEEVLLKKQKETKH